MPIRIPPFGCSAVPLPNNHSPPALADAAVRSGDVDTPSSRRTNPSCAHISGAKAGAAGPPPEGCAARPDSAPVAAGSAIATGALTRTAADTLGRATAASGTTWPSTTPATAPPEDSPGANKDAPPEVERIGGTLSIALPVEADGPATAGRADTFAPGPASSSAARPERPSVAAAAGIRPGRGVPAAEDRDLPGRADLSRAAVSPDLGPAAGPEAELDSESVPAPGASANATAGIDATAEPTPTATATAPTRPREPLTRSDDVDEPIGVPSLEACLPV